MSHPVKWSLLFTPALRDCQAEEKPAKLAILMGSFHAMAIVFGLGVAYFLAAIPTGVAMHLHPAVAAVCAWAGYTAIGVAMLAIGGPARRWLATKFKVSTHPNPEKRFWRVWLRWGMPGLGLLAPVTCGPYFAALIALALGEKPRRVMFWIAAGVIPWCILFAILAATGSSLLKK